ncbi:MAG: IS66 family transposase [Bacteroidales bacterium]|nr:IS66 family transposase [Bacteroidales bacterium]
MDRHADINELVESLLLERDELYRQVSRLRNSDAGALEASEQKNREYEAKIKQQEAQIKQMADQLAWYRRKLWKSQSEKYIPQDPNQRKIDFEGLDILPEEEQAIKEAEKEIVSYEKNKPKKEKKQPVRLPLPEELRREEEIIEPAGIDESWVRIGEEVTEILEHKPGEIYVRRIVRPTYALKKSSQKTAEINNKETVETIKTATLPLLPLARSNAGASLLAELLVGKYVFHLPFHRQLAMLKLTGVSISASTVNDWFAGSCDMLRALYLRLKEIVLSSDYIQVDESTVPVIDNKKHKTVKAYLWMVRSVMEKQVFFHYDKGSRAGKVVVELLKDYQGAVQTDGYEAYSIYEQKKGVLLLGCWAHARRKFNEALKEDKSGAEYALGQIGMLYKVEAMATDQGMDFVQRADLRKRLAYPILCAFEKWITNYYPKVSPKGRMGKALSYTYSLFHRLSRYHLDGRYQPDNNLAENAIRPLALGRKNYMFCGNHDAAENAAIIYSLLGCCKANDVNPREWLIDVLSKLPKYNSDYSLDLADLLPHNWKSSKEIQ